MQKFDVYGRLLDDHDAVGRAHFVRYSDYRVEAEKLFAEIERLRADRKRVFDAGYEWAALRKGTPEQGFDALEGEEDE